MSWNYIDGLSTEMNEGTLFYIDQNTNKLFELLSGKTRKQMMNMLNMILSKDKIDEFIQAGDLGDNKIIYPLIKDYFLQDSDARFASGILLHLNGIYINDDVVNLEDIINLINYNFI